MDELDVEQRSKLRSPPPPSQHQDEEGELEDDEIENDLDVEIADIAEQKKLAMEDLDKNNDDEKLNDCSDKSLKGLGWLAEF